MLIFFVGLSDPQALNQAVSAYQACHFVGMPECDVGGVFFLYFIKFTNFSYSFCLLHSCAFNKCLCDIWYSFVWTFYNTWVSDVTFLLLSSVIWTSSASSKQPILTKFGEQYVMEVGEQYVMEGYCFRISKFHASLNSDCTI